MLGPNKFLRKKLNKNINKNKKKGMVAPMHCPARINQTKSVKFADLGQVRGTDQNCSIITAENQTIIDGSPHRSGFAIENQVTGKFDLMIRSNCLKQTITLLEEHKAMIEREYSVMIVSQGIWEVIKPWDCRIQNVTAATRVVEVLNNLRALSGPSLFVIWKTHGPHPNHINTPTLGEGIIAAVHNWFLEEQPSYMDLADFRSAVRERTFGALRIKGDLIPHWGLDARLLSIEIISHVVEKKQKREGKTAG